MLIDISAELFKEIQMRQMKAQVLSSDNINVSLCIYVYMCT